MDGKVLFRKWKRATKEIIKEHGVEFLCNILDAISSATIDLLNGPAMQDSDTSPASCNCGERCACHKEEETA